MHLQRLENYIVNVSTGNANFDLNSITFDFNAGL